MITCTILPSGDLKLTAGNAARRWLAEERQDGRSYYRIMTEAMEHYWTRGSFRRFDAGDGNPHVGFTSAPCIAEDMVLEDDGEWKILGRVWWLANYAIVDDLEELIRKGRVIYQFGFNADDDASAEEEV